MDAILAQIIPFLQSLSGWQWAGIAVLAFLAYNKRAALLSQLPSFKLPSFTKSEPDGTEAYEAVQLLIAHFERVKCKEGVEAAREAGRCLFHSPGEHQ